jgi:hypothetical protein
LPTAAFAQLTGLAEASHKVEDLRDLNRSELALREFEELGARQSTLEASQDRARVAFRDLTALVRELQSRVQVLEAQSKLQLSPAQRGTVYQLVQTWGSAQAARQPDRRSGEAIRACWRQFNQRFGISTYTDLPVARYDEAIQFIKAQYRALTGTEIDAVEQAAWSLNDDRSAQHRRARRSAPARGALTGRPDCARSRGSDRAEAFNHRQI